MLLITNEPEKTLARLSCAPQDDEVIPVGSPSKSVSIKNTFYTSRSFSKQRPYSNQEAHFEERTITAPAEVIVTETQTYCYKIYRLINGERKTFNVSKFDETKTIATYTVPIDVGNSYYICCDDNTDYGWSGYSEQQFDTYKSEVLAYAEEHFLE